MKKFGVYLLLIVGCLNFCHPLEAFESKYPAAISFMIADLKYNKEEGVKICEVQPLLASGLNRNHQEDPLFVAKEVSSILNHYLDNGWISNQINDSYFLEIYKGKGWKIFGEFKELERDEFFNDQAYLNPNNPYSLYGYHGFVYLKKSMVSSIHDAQRTYPGMLFIDAPIIPYDEDKYLTDALFDEDDTLKTYRPKWGLYSKEYTPQLATTILNDLKTDIVVIKPRGGSTGNGVIIVEGQDLDKILQMILYQTSALESHPHRSFSYWAKDKDDSFTVEAFHTSDTVISEDKLYDATMRVTFGLTYHRGTIDIYFLDKYWKLPRKSLDEKGSLLSKHRSSTSGNFRAAVDDRTWKRVQRDLKVAMPLLFKQMLMGK